MIIPIFIPIKNDCDNKHGHGCKCPECLEKEKWERMPKEFYRYRYAVPFSFFFKNLLAKILCITIVVIGLIVLFSSIFLIKYMNQHIWLLPVTLISGMFIIIGSYRLSNKIIKEAYDCKDKIYIEAKNLYLDREEWKDKLKTVNIPKGYVLTKEENSWRYKK